MVHGDDGFTLVELIVTIAILGIVTSVVVLGVGQLSAVGDDASCEADRKTLEIGASTYLLLEEVDEYDGAVGDAFEETLVAQGIIRTTSRLHDLDAHGAAVPVDDRCTT